jgi:hypothetical protein
VRSVGIGCPRTERDECPEQDQDRDPAFSQPARPRTKGRLGQRRSDVSRLAPTVPRHHIDIPRTELVARSGCGALGA